MKRVHKTPRCEATASSRPITRAEFPMSKKQAPAAGYAATGVAVGNTGTTLDRVLTARQGSMVLNRGATASPSGVASSYRIVKGR